MKRNNKAVIIISHAVEDTEFAYPYYRLQEAGLHVDVATRGKIDVQGKWGLPIKATVDANLIKAADYDVFVIPGGYESPDRVRQIPNVLECLREADAAGKIIASICHGPWVLISAKIVRGRQMTCYVGCKDDLINAGALYQDAPVVVDRNVITAPHFRNNPEWMRETLRVYQMLFPK
ncbi:MAG: type 1 glutamine amidotransferase [Methylacidiphilales bacterium]|nr:type 1 glutamine amidotransferase [Candidatus Methylacidiphilales bacterium]MDW8348730.1 type 1 glutamine amidotransferase domain-containing protein [Verrucomicrobiae bacterium]